MVHTLFSNDVYLDKDTHQYFDKDGREYMSFTRFFSFLSPKFDANMIAAATAKRDDTTKEAVLGKWQATADEGTRLDKTLKAYSQTGKIIPEGEGLEQVVREVSKKYVDYHRCYEDLVVFSKDYRVAGEIDKLSLTSNRRNCTFHISDFKRFEGGMTYEAKGQRFLNYPLDYLPNTKYVKIGFQLSFYAYLFEQLTNHKCEKLFIDLVIPQIANGVVVGHKNEVIPVNYMKREIEFCLEHFSNRVITALDGRKYEQIEDEF